MTLTERIEAEQRSDVAVVMRSENGRRFIWRILSSCGIYHDNNFEEALQMAREAGRRSVGLNILGIISDVDDELVFKMMREAKEHEEQLAVQAENEEKNGVVDSVDLDDLPGINKFIS